MCYRRKHTGVQVNLLSVMHADDAKRSHLGKDRFQVTLDVQIIVRTIVHYEIDRLGSLREKRRT